MDVAEVVELEGVGVLVELAVFEEAEGVLVLVIDFRVDGVPVDRVQLNGVLGIVEEVVILGQVIGENASLTLEGLVPHILHRLLDLPHPLTDPRNQLLGNDVLVRQLLEELWKHAFIVENHLVVKAQVLFLLLIRETLDVLQSVERVEGLLFLLLLLLLV